MRWIVRIPVQVTSERGRPDSFTRWGMERLDVPVDAEDLTDLQGKLDRMGERLGKLLSEEGKADEGA